MKYVMLLQVKETENSKTECKAIRLPEDDKKFWESHLVDYADVITE